ncbi:Rha family transcriptional regulator [Faecalispora jeddahensis]|uniref:Rha family transcriptional regulator n=1 Tax=Faecalispora jeddahensis TaxID=1414721 RepID=UPI0005A8A2DB|nr:Rha family transcriptional regulator [Faecalispora jeddahensis]
MNDLTIINRDGILLADSRDVAVMVDKPHNDLMKSIRQYCEYLNVGGFSLVDFFIDSTYLDGKGEERPCYLITRKGCDMVANKMTGAKGVLFTAAYVTKFEEMEKQLTAPPMNTLDFLEYSIKAMRDQQKALEDTNKRIDSLGELISLNPNSWRPDARGLIVKIAQKMGGNDYIREVQSEIFKLVDARAGTSLATRLTNKRRRMADEGICKSKRDKLTKTDVIADDKKLIEIYLAVVKEMAVKYGVCEKSA